MLYKEGHYVNFFPDFRLDLVKWLLRLNTIVTLRATKKQIQPSLYTEYKRITSKGTGKTSTNRNNNKNKIQWKNITNISTVPLPSCVPGSWQDWVRLQDPDAAKEEERSTGSKPPEQGPGIPEFKFILTFSLMVLISWGLLKIPFS